MASFYIQFIHFIDYNRAENTTDNTSNPLLKNKSAVTQLNEQHNTQCKAEWSLFIAISSLWNNIMNSGMTTPNYTHRLINENMNEMIVLLQSSL